jgi:hypothetical protein
MTVNTRRAGLDWHGFSAAYFPGRRRHDMEALTAYGAYKRLQWPREPPSGETSRALDDWKDEDGQAR